MTRFRRLPSASASATVMALGLALGQPVDADMVDRTPKAPPAIHIDRAGVSPTSLRLRPGEAVRFVNDLDAATRVVFDARARDLHCYGSAANESRRGQFLLSRNASMRCEGRGHVGYTIYRPHEGRIEETRGKLTFRRRARDEAPQRPRPVAMEPSARAPR